MGFLDRLLGREREDTDAFWNPTAGAPRPPTHTGEPPPVPFDSPPTAATRTRLTASGEPVPPEQAQAFAAAFQDLGNLAQLGESQVVDLSGVPGLRERVLGAVSQHANDPAALQRVLTDVMRATAESRRPLS